MTKKFQEIKKLGKVVVFLIDFLYIDLRPQQVHLFRQESTPYKGFILIFRSILI